MGTHKDVGDLISSFSTVSSFLSYFSPLSASCSPFHTEVNLPLFPQLSLSAPLPSSLYLGKLGPNCMVPEAEPGSLAWWGNFKDFGRGTHHLPLYPSSHVISPSPLPGSSYTLFSLLSQSLIILLFICLLSALIWMDQASAG